MSSTSSKTPTPAASPSGLPLVRALERGVALLRAFSATKPRQTLSELAREAELDKGTARRLLHTLIVQRLVDYDPTSGLYSMAVGVLELASAVETGRELREVAAPFLGSITEQTRATAFLWVYHEGTALCVERVRAAIPDVNAAWFSVGARTTLNCGGGPRTLLAFISEQERALALSLPLQKRTPASQTDVQALENEAALIREQGWELAIDDFVVGLAAIGVPIFDSYKRLLGSLSITTLTSELVEDGKPRQLDLLLEAARNIGTKVI